MIFTDGIQRSLSVFHPLGEPAKNASVQTDAKEVGSIAARAVGADAGPSATQWTNGDLPAAAARATCHPVACGGLRCTNGCPKA